MPQTKASERSLNNNMEWARFRLSEKIGAKIVNRASASYTGNVTRIPLPKASERSLNNNMEWARFHPSEKIGEKNDQPKNFYLR